MNIENMRAWVKSRYTHLYGRGGVRVPIERCPNSQVMAAYYSMSKRETAKAMRKSVSHVNKNKQHVFDFVKVV